MHERNALPFFLSIFFLVTAVAVSVSEADGQGRYTSRYSRADVSGIINRLETTSDVFARAFNREMDRSSLNGTEAENRFTQNVRRYENSLDRLRRDYDRTDTWWESRGNVQNVINDAQSVNTMMNSLPFRRNLERQWSNMRRDLNTLADTFDLPGLDGGGWIGGPGGGAGGGTRPPAWAQGTWYWRNGPDRTLTISSNGAVTLYTGGRTSYGTYRRGQITLDGYVSTVTRVGSNLRTYNTGTGETSDYSRTAFGGGGGFPGGGGTIPPTWARGTWYWVQGPDRRLTIANNGRVTLYTGRRTSYGTYENGTIILDGNVSTVTRVGNRIRTYNQSTGETSDYRRQ